MKLEILVKNETADDKYKKQLIMESFREEQDQPVPEADMYEDYRY